MECVGVAEEGFNGCFGWEGRGAMEFRGGSGGV